MISKQLTMLLALALSLVFLPANAAEVFDFQSKITKTASDYGVLSILPSALAIFLAFMTRQIVVSLFAGVWLGAIILEGGDLSAVLNGLLRVVDTYITRALTPSNGSIDHISVAIFTLLIGGMVGIVSANGGMHGVVHWMARYAKTRRQGQFSAFFMGFVIFFDDYANTLIVGKTLRPLMDRLHISREKLSFIVDATAAPIACIAFVTTWIGFELALFDQAMPNTPGLHLTSYQLFIGMVPYSFYPILLLIFIALSIYSGRDFGPMLRAEKMAREQHLGDVVPDLPAGSTGAYKAMIPILILIIATVVGLDATGSGSTLIEIIGSSDPFKAMLWASLISLITAVLLSVIKGGMEVSEAVAAMEDGFKPMVLAIIILVLAWAIAALNTDLMTANYVVSLLGDSVPSHLAPALIFVISMLAAFATGSSWGVMAIIMPIALPLTWSMMGHEGIANAEHFPILFAAVASVMSGAVFGDHCSPISDTTILSSIASDCPHMNHVHTQMPYALFVAAIALVFGLIPISYGVPLVTTYAVAAGAMYVFLGRFGTRLV